MANRDAIFGVHPVLEALEAGRQIDRLYLKKGTVSPATDRMLEICREDRVPVQYVPVEKLDRLVQGNHQGVVAQVSPIEYADLPTVVNEALEKGGNPLIVILDGVTDVRNFGAVARSAECAGADALVVPIKNGAPVNADALKSSAGALNRIPVCRAGSIRNTIKYLQSCEIRVAAADEKGEKTLYEGNLTGPVAVVMGAEDRGVSKEVLKLCDERLSIPMRGKIGSLNVSAAAAVMLFEAVRQRMKA